MSSHTSRESGRPNMSPSAVRRDPALSIPSKSAQRLSLYPQSIPQSAQPNPRSISPYTASPPPSYTTTHRTTNFSRPRKVVADSYSQDTSNENSAITPSPNPFGTRSPPHIRPASPSVESIRTISHPTAQSEISTIKTQVDKLDQDSHKLGEQRYVPAPRKGEEMSKLALGAKLDRALGRRMESQDAVMRPRKGTLDGDMEKGAIAA